MTKNGKLTIAGLATCAIAFLPQDTFAHSGGLDSRGCHAGTQPYHCHRSSKEDEDEKTALAVVGGLLALWLILEVIKNMKGEDDESTLTAFSLESPEPSPLRIGPYISPNNEIGMAAEYSSEKFGVIGFNTMTERSSVGLHWKIEF